MWMTFKRALQLQTTFPRMDTHKFQMINCTRLAMEYVHEKVKKPFWEYVLRKGIVFRFFSCPPIRSVSMTQI